MHIRDWSLGIGLALTLALGGCSTPGENDILDDEPMRRARLANKSPQDAAREWYYPKEIHDYFPGMDQVAVLGDPAADQPVDPLSTPVYQLLDTMPVGAVRKVDAIRFQGVRLYEGQLCQHISLEACEVLGRNTWMLWVGGNEGFWDWLSVRYGFIDLLRLVDSRERSTRFDTGGLINEPGMVKASAPDEFGLWLDVPEDPELREWRRTYIRQAFRMDRSSGSGGSGGLYGMPPTADSMAGYGGDTPYDPRLPPPEIYGLSSGVVGLRLFPNPNFDEDAQERWDARRFYESPEGDPTLVRPYRVGMACAFCHASYHPLNPPPDLVNPQWSNISGNIGAQYLRPRVAFANLLPKENFIYHILDSQPPGTIDTSLIASDNVNNPNTMNAVFNLPQRALVSMRNPKEQLSGASERLPSIWVDPQGGPDAGDAPTDYWQKVFAAFGLTEELHGSNESNRRVPRILFDGADSIGAYGALARVYLNIGTNWEQWNTLHEPILGFAPQRPFTLDGARRHSVYWHATQLRVGPLRDYFLKVTPPMPLLQAGAESERPSVDAAKLAAGRRVFARNCIVCHSSIQPQMRHDEMQRFADAGELWDHDPGRWLSDPAYLAWAEQAVEDPQFWRANYLSTDYRVSVNLVGTNACRAMATNAMTGNMWEDYSSRTYQRLPSPGPIPFFNPYLGESGGDSTFTPRHAQIEGAPPGGGGPGFYRVPTLVSIWATAPYLHNNSLGLFNNDPSVKGRLAAFDDGIRKLLWPARRLQSSSYNGATPQRLRADRGLIWRTSEETHVTIGGAYLPGLLGSRVPFLGNVARRYPVLTELTWWQRPLLSLALFAVAFVVLLRARRFSTRLLGYAAIVLALVGGAVIYFLGGAIGGLRLGPIPAGTPVNLIASVNAAADRALVRRALATTSSALIEIRATNAPRAEADRIMRTKVAPALLGISKCPDFVMDRGHYFAWFDSMTDADKEALIELLKTF